MSRRQQPSQYIAGNKSIYEGSTVNLAVIGQFAGVPTASVSGYEIGALAFDTTNGNWYRNTGSTTSATWTRQTGVETIADLTATNANISNLVAITSALTNSNVSNLVAITSALTNSTQTNSVITTATVTNAALTNAAISNGSVSGTITMGSGGNIATNATTGTMIGTTNLQKVGFWGTTPIIKPLGTGEVLGTVALKNNLNASAVYITNLSTFNGNAGATAYNVSDVVKALKNCGILTA